MEKNIIDGLVNRWIIKKWEGDSYKYDLYGPIEECSIVQADAGWHCGCYSSWTRDDEFVVEAIINTPKLGWIRYSYGTWGDFPKFLEELSDFERLEDVCRIERRL